MKNFKLFSGILMSITVISFSYKLSQNDKLFPQVTYINQCSDLNCLICESSSPSNCLKCQPNLFLYNNSKCVKVCPENYINDVMTYTCKPIYKKKKTNDYSYIKINSLGSCKNLCGAVSLDCSCSQDCYLSNNCCKDYKYCEDLFEKNQFRQGECSFISNCELCNSFSDQNCAKCKEGFFNKDNKCVPSCSIDDKIILPNKICITNGRKCKVDNCGDCNGDSQNEICRECIEGFYLDKIQNKCVQQCKERMRADNLTWECRDEKANNIYWIVGSKSSCEGLCNLEKDIGKGMDCSCDFLCYRRGDCCKDVESKCTFNKNYNL